MSDIPMNEGGTASFRPSCTDVHGEFFYFI